MYSANRSMCMGNDNKKSLYRLIREDRDLTREAASEILVGIQPERLEKIENGKINILPEDVLALAKGYNAPELCNYYCSQQCVIGRQYVPQIELKDLSQIAVETLNGLNRINKEKERLLEIVEDGRITSDEIDDFENIQETLQKIAIASETLRLWVEQAQNNGKIEM